MAVGRKRRASDHRLSILLLSEDSGKHAHRVLEALSKKFLRLVHGQCQTQRVKFDPANDDARVAMHANSWKSRDRRKLIILARIIAERIAMPHGFVFFHADGDRVYSERAESENRTKFHDRIVNAVRQQLLHSGRDSDEVEKLMERLLLLMPFYSIEAWLYQNIDLATRLCREHYNGRDLERFAHWREHRSAIDELARPKDCVCLADKHNLELASDRYPAQPAYAAGTSLHDAVDALRACTSLVALLATTCH